MKRNIEIIMALLAVALFCAQGHAQLQPLLSYKPLEYLNIGAEKANPNYSVNAEGFNLLKFSGSGGYFAVNTKATYCYLMGIGWTVSFYDNYLKKFNDIRALYVLTRANGEIYDSYTDPEGDLEMLRELRPVTYKMRASESEMQTRAMESQIDTASVHIGFVAQEVERSNNEAAKADANGNKMVNYVGLLPMLTRNMGAMYRRASATAAIIESLGGDRKQMSNELQQKEK